jgi:formylglycine-generating enzyme required for sulfatase activity
MMGERHALLIGTDKFEDPELSTLLAPVADVEALSAVLRDPAICDFASAPVLLNPGIVELQKALRTLFNDRAADDLVLLYYTGHGLRDPDSGTLYLALHETMRAEPSIGSLEADYVRKRMKSSLAGTQIIVLDCCHSGAFMADAAKGSKGLPSYVEVRDAFDTGGSGHYIMSACSKSEAAFEDRREKPQSIFTQYLVDGLRTGDAAPDQDAITIDALYKYTRKQVIDRKWPMNPQRWIVGSGDPVIARNPNIRKDVPKELREMLLTGDKYQQLGAVQQLRAHTELGNASYTAGRALEVLREGLKASDWISVQEAIRNVPGIIEVVRPSAPKSVMEEPSPNVTNDENLISFDKISGVLAAATKRRIRFPVKRKLLISFSAACISLGLLWNFWLPKSASVLIDGYNVEIGGSIRDNLPGRLTSPVMVLLPAGTFEMGSQNGVGSPDEHPQHQVKIARPFLVGKFEVTFDEWQDCVKDGGCQSNREPSDSGIGRGRYPVINVSWNDTQEYVEWLSTKTGKNYRLLSEAEWEYAARAGTITEYSTGDTITITQAQIAGSGKSATVGSFQANTFGLFDMHGNVWEWVQDCFEESYINTPIDGGVSSDNNRCKKMRVNRGGGWGSTLPDLRSANRGAGDPAFHDDFMGFRLARTI